MNNIKRKNQIMLPASKAEIERTLFEQSKRFSDPTRRLTESEMRQKLFQVKLKNYNPEKMRAKVRWNLILIVVLSFLIFFGNGINQYRDKTADIVFCDTDDYSYLSDESKCVPCPNHGRCEGGKLIGCYDNYIVKDNTCVRNEALDLLVSKMVQRLTDILSYRKGDEICYGNDAEYSLLPLKELKTTLSEFKYDKNFDTAIDQLTRDFKLSLHRYPNIVTEYKQNPQTGLYEDYITINTFKFNLYCKTKMFAIDHKLSILAFMIACLIMWLVTKRTIKRRKLSIRAEEIYKRNLLALHSENKINRKHLLINESDQNVKDRDALMEEIERIRILDEQVTLYQSEGEIYWVLV